jgi:hypothetical protein
VTIVPLTPGGWINAILFVISLLFLEHALAISQEVLNVFLGSYALFLD